MSRKVVIPFSDSPTDDRLYLANFSDADYEKYLSMTEEQKKKVIKKYSQNANSNGTEGFVVNPIVVKL